MRLSAGKASGGATASSAGAASERRRDGLSALARPFKLRLTRRTSARVCAITRPTSSSSSPCDPQRHRGLPVPPGAQPAGAAPARRGRVGVGRRRGGARRSTRRSAAGQKPDAEEKEPEPEDEEDEDVDEDEMIAEAEMRMRRTKTGPPRMPWRTSTRAGPAPRTAPRRRFQREPSGTRRSTHPTAAAAAAAAPPRLFSADGAGPFHPTTTVLQAVYAAASPPPRTPPRRAPARAWRRRWERTHTLQYMLTPTGEPLPPPPPGAAGAPPPRRAPRLTRRGARRVRLGDRRAAPGAALPRSAGRCAATRLRPAARSRRTRFSARSPCSAW